MAGPVLTEKILSLCNRLLADDPETLEKLAALSGKIITIETLDSSLVMHIQIHDQGVRLLEAFDGKTDVKINAGPMALLHMAANRETSVSASTPDMEISGDIGLAQQLQSVMRGLEIDWEEYLSHWVGDTPARKILRMARHSREFLTYSGSRLGMDISEYLRYEKHWFPVQLEIDEFVDAVDVLRNDVERFRQRIDRVEHQLFNGSND